MASFSNWDDLLGGDHVNFSAPGFGILSLTQIGGLVSWNGTSMAAPHVAGLLLLYEGVEAGDIGTPNAGGYADPLAVIGKVSTSPSPTASPNPSPDSSQSPTPESDELNDGFMYLSDDCDTLTGQSGIKLRIMGGMTSLK